jgi:lipopolysaccharide transport system ATP-binding protein
MALIEVNNISKKFLLAHEKAGSYLALRDILSEKLRRSLRISRSNSDSPVASTEEFWALRNISFEVGQGETIGIIGRNGAGKSTLLKILSRITEPSSGTARIRGRIASLLEVGTGFHPELTGRENIFLNGAILGMSRNEVRAKFDEIVDFAEVEKFLDTPVKRYSSGMYLRLAFAVAAHLDPEILIVDEVLAVGDYAFQKKCLGKMNQVNQEEGKTLLLVSHNLGAINQLCSKCLFLDKGSLVSFTNTREALDQYVSYNKEHNTQYINMAPRSKSIYFKSIHLANEQGHAGNEFFYSEGISVNFSLSVNMDLADNSALRLFVTVVDAWGMRIFSSESAIIKNQNIRMDIPARFLVRGSYKLTAMVHQPWVEQVDKVEDVCEFRIIDNESPFALYGDYNYGVVFSDCKWNYL